jgi:hypothetical protein
MPFATQKENIIVIVMPSNLQTVSLTPSGGVVSRSTERSSLFFFWAVFYFTKVGEWLEREHSVYPQSNY